MRLSGPSGHVQQMWAAAVCFWGYSASHRVDVVAVANMVGLCSRKVVGSVPLYVLPLYVLHDRGEGQRA